MGTKLRAALGVKGFLCVASLITIALALVYYTAVVTINPYRQFIVGATTDDWRVYVNDIDQVRYLPGDGTPAGSVTPVGVPPSDGNVSTFAFKVWPDASRACAVNITLDYSSTDLANFSKFEIRVMYWNTLSAGWEKATIYNASSGGPTKDFINGTAADFGYILQSVSTELYYLMNVTYSYDIADYATPFNVTFSYTPLPQSP